MAQAQQGIPDVNADEQLKALVNYEGVLGYVIYNSEGIPLKKMDSVISHEKAVQYAALLGEFWNVTNKIIKRGLKKPDNEIDNIRMRTAQQTELIISQVGDLYIVCIQDCNLSNIGQGKRKTSIIQGEEAKEPQKA